MFYLSTLMLNPTCIKVIGVQLNELCKINVYLRFAYWQEKAYRPHFQKNHKQ